MRSEKPKESKDWLSRIAAVIALLLSWRANCISEEALRYERHAFNVLNEAHLELRPAKPENSSFIQLLQKSPGDSTLRLYIQIEIRNTGKIDAVDITYPASIAKVNLLGMKRNIPLSKPPGSPIALPAGTSYYYGVSLDLSSAGKKIEAGTILKDLDRHLDKFEEEEFPAVVELAVQYKDASTLQVRKVIGKFGLTNSVSCILSYEY